MLELSRKVAGAVGLGYLGVDIVIDANHGPLLLEANARPGLAIQIANARGLVQPLKAIDSNAERKAQSAECEAQWAEREAPCVEREAPCVEREIPSETPSPEVTREAA